jgi:hypothetical protein
MKMSKNIDDLLEEWDPEKWEKEIQQKQENAKNKGKVYFWFYNLLNDTSIYGFRTGHMLIHPLKILKYTWYELTYAWDRVFKGYDQRVAWSIDMYLNEMMPIWLKELKDSKPGIPMVLFNKEDFDEMGCTTEGTDERVKKEFEEIIEKMIAGFEANAAMDKLVPSSSEYVEKEKIWLEGMGLFVKYYNTLWS